MWQRSQSPRPATTTSSSTSGTRNSTSGCPSKISRWSENLTVNDRLRPLVALLLSCWLAAAAPAAPPPQASETLTLEAATEQFLRRNLAVEAARLEVGVAEAERIGARLRPRPELTVTAE